jgi:hypothetical protein
MFVYFITADGDLLGIKAMTAELTLDWFQGDAL